MGGGGVGGGGISFASVCVQGIEVLLYPSSSSQGFPLAQTDTDKKNFRFPLLKGEKQCQFFEMRIFSLSLTRRCSIGHALCRAQSERKRERGGGGGQQWAHACGAHISAFESLPSRDFDRVPPLLSKPSPFIPPPLSLSPSPFYSVCPALREFNPSAPVTHSDVCGAGQKS